MCSLSLGKPIRKRSSARLSKTKRVLAVVAASGMMVSLGCGQLETDRPHRYEATVVKTEYGIPHITAESWGSLGFGEAYTAAEDHTCNMALALVQSRGESAAVFGPGPRNRNLSRDIVVKALGIPERAGEALAAQEPQIKEWIEGYTAGYNRFVSERAGNFGSWCDKATWVRPVTAAEFMAQYVTLVYTLPRIAGAITAAAPPAPQTEMSAAIAALEVAPPLRDTLSDMKLRDMGSNAWAIASERSENGRGLLLANPHYPWYGISRFWEKHLTIPGVYDAYGVGLIGTPGVLIGFNENVGWTHTVSDSKRTVIYQLALNPDNPRQYRWENDWRELSSVEVSANVKTADGLKNQQHKVWFSHHGPLIALPGLTDDLYTAFAVRDANASNLHTFAQWQAMGSAKNMDDFIDAHRNYNAMPWVNTIAASSDGRAVYIDNSNVGALSEEAILNWHNTLKAVPKLQYLYLSRGLVILDGSQQGNEWLETNSPVPHTEPFERRPLIESNQYVFNANDSYWLSDPDKPAAALSPLYGPTMTPRSVRTRMNIALLRPDSQYGHAGEDGKFSRGEIQTALFSNESLTADMLLPQLLAACDASPQRIIEDTPVNLTKACNILASWDRRFNSESRGAVLFREWITQYPADETSIGSSLFQQPFNPMEAATTPAGLTNTELALDRLARAILLLEAEGIGLDTALGNLQIGHRSERQYPVHGGNRHEGIANLQMSTTVGNNPTETPIFTGSDEFAGGSNSLSKSGYNVVHGSSFIMTLGWNDAGPEAEGMLSYSQSGDPESPHFDDQTQLYAEKTWRPIRFMPSDIEDHTVSRKVVRSLD
ncbi:MAG: penicillin acylase family protein [Pseudomonadota bacterium]|nr:penicillin acylase family protein [Pseudomonadota bacterium]